MAVHTYIALLRGINVGGKNKLPMADLRQIFADAGCEDVTTYIQSGNVIFTAGATLAKKLPRVIPKAIADELGLKVPVVIRSADALKKVAKANPYAKLKTEPKFIAISFLSAKPAAADVKRLDPNRSPGDTFVVKGEHIYLHYPNGVARSKLTSDYLDSTLKVLGTARNWRTVGKLIELADGS